MKKRRLGMTEDAADRLNATTQRVNQMDREKLFDDGIVVRLGRLKRWDLDRLEDWIARGGKALEGGWRHDPDDRAAHVQGDVREASR